MAFQTAAGIAYKEGLPTAGPTLLEPIGELKVFIRTPTWAISSATSTSAAAA